MPRPDPLRPPVRQPPCCFSYRVKFLHVFPRPQICIRGSDQARPCSHPPHFSLWEGSSEARKGALPRTNGTAGVCMLPPAQQSLIFSSPPQSQGCPMRTCQRQPPPPPPNSPSAGLARKSTQDTLQRALTVFLLQSQRKDQPGF